MRASMTNLWGKWPRKTAKNINLLMNTLVFLLFDFLDFIMGILFRYIDRFLEGKSTSCNCQSQSENGAKGCEEKNIGVSNAKCSSLSKIGIDDLREPRWSDCGCESCVSWMNYGSDRKLHVVVKEPTKGSRDIDVTQTENVIFLHGFLSSSFLWTETVFPLLISSKYRLFAVDLLGFGYSPKPRECLYTLNDHLEMVEKSVIREHDLTSFHLVAHSMGCIIALALAAKHPNVLKSITLIAPPYFISTKEEDASEIAMRRLANKRLWPPLLFGCAFMTWYEHLGRFVCFVVCRNHRTWERILKLLTRKRRLHFLLMDLTRHTHHSAWHTMHNVICGGAKMMDPCLEILKQARARVTVIQGSKDELVPVECSNNIKLMVPDTKVNIITGANHRTVIIGREEQFSADLVILWDSVTHAKG